MRRYGRCAIPERWRCCHAAAGKEIVSQTLKLRTSYLNRWSQTKWSPSAWFTTSKRNLHPHKLYRLSHAVITTAITMTITNAAPCVSCSPIVIKSHWESNNARHTPERRQVTILLKEHADDAVIFLCVYNDAWHRRRAIRHSGDLLVVDENLDVTDRIVMIWYAEEHIQLGHPKFALWLHLASTAADDAGPGGFVELRFEMASLLQEKNIMRCSNNKMERAVPNETLQFSSFVLKGGEKKSRVIVLYSYACITTVDNKHSCHATRLNKSKKYVITWTSEDVSCFSQSGWNMRYKSKTSLLWDQNELKFNQVNAETLSLKWADTYLLEANAEMKCNILKGSNVDYDKKIDRLWNAWELPPCTSKQRRHSRRCFPKTNISCY